VKEGLGTVELINFGSGSIWAEESAAEVGWGEYPSRNWNKQLHGLSACSSSGSSKARVHHV
jgi:hypothetical protein